MKYVKVISLFLALSLLFAFAACGNGGKSIDQTTAEQGSDNAAPSADDDKPIEMLAAYFPYDETSVKTAKLVSELTGAKLFALETQNGYPDDSELRLSQAKDEAEKNLRPALKNKLSSLSSCVVVFVCTPLWENNLPMAFYTFFEDYDLRDRVIVPFCASESSDGAARVSSLIKDKLPASLVLDGMTVSPTAEPDKNAINTFIDDSLNN